VEEIHYPGGCLFIVVTRPGTRIEWLLEQMVPGNFLEDRGNEALAVRKEEVGEKISPARDQVAVSRGQTEGPRDQSTVFRRPAA
jgi:hypothetical protein